MKLLIDENLSPHLVRLLCEHFPGSVHVEDCGLLSLDDLTIWSYAAANSFTILTRDSDFGELSILKGAPPKVIHLAIGNCTTKAVAEFLKSSLPILAEFAESPESTYLLLRRA
jgi:predicted nuclease of predicted toxin-antitoxin system